MATSTPLVPATVVSGLRLTTLAEQRPSWPTTGRHILAHHDDTHVVVYQAFNAGIAAHAVRHQTFRDDCPGYNPTRMTWVKTNFLWMMYRCGWAGKDANQARVLAISLSREGFDELLAAAVEIPHGAPAAADAGGDAAAAGAEPDTTPGTEAGAPTGRSRGGARGRGGRQRAAGAVRADPVRLQWDPDHTPAGGKCERRAIQLGMRGAAVLQKFRTPVAEGGWLRGIEDITDTLVAPQRALAMEGRASDWGALVVPVESVLTPLDPALLTHIAASPVPTALPPPPAVADGDT